MDMSFDVGVCAPASYVPTPATKHCTTCGTTKAVAEFHKNKATKDGLAAKCKTCVKQYGRRYRHDNRDAILEGKAEYRQRNRDAIAAYTAKYECGPSAPAWLTDEQLEAITALYWESARLTEETGERHQVDHIVPRRGVNEDGQHIVSGLHVPWNLQVLTATENRAKSNLFVQD